jgi:hypothetical protein
MAPAPARKSTAKAAAPPRKSTAKAAAPTGVTVKPAAPVHLSLQGRHDIGREARRRVPRSNHGVWEPAAGRLDPVTLLEEQNATRVSWLVPCATPGCGCRR